MQIFYTMPMCFTVITGLILVSVLFVLWCLIVLDLENQKNQKIFSATKVKSRLLKKQDESVSHFR